MQFKNRSQAGRLLGEKLKELDLALPLVLALPRGGVPVAAVAAKILGVPFDVYIVRKIGTPDEPELGAGAVTEDNTTWWNEPLLARLGFEAEDFEEAKTREVQKIEAQKQAFRGERELPTFAGRNLILIDDGLATGATMHAAIKGVKRKGAERVVVGVPVSLAQTANNIRSTGVELVSVEEPDLLDSVGSWYTDFTQVEDSEVQDLLRTR